MKKKYLVSIILFVFISCLIITGCGPENVSDEVKIKEQMNKWAEGIIESDVAIIKSVMKSEGIKMVFDDDEETDLTVDEYIELLEFSLFTDMFYDSRIEIDNISISGNYASLYGKWLVMVENMGTAVIIIESDFEKINDTWLIASTCLQVDSIIFEGDREEEFDVSKHKAYLSFIIDGEQYLFHDKYGGCDVGTEIIPESNRFIINGIEHSSVEEDRPCYFELELYYKGEEAGQFKDIWFSNLLPDDDDYYVSDIIIEESDYGSYDIDGGLVSGTFSVTLKNHEGNEVEISEGFFYFEHEFNLPVVSIEEPEDGEIVSGKITI